MLDGVFDYRNYYFVSAGNQPRRSTFGHNVIGGDRTKVRFNVIARDRLEDMAAEDDKERHRVFSPTSELTQAGLPRARRPAGSRHEPRRQENTDHRKGVHWPAGGCQSSTLFPSGSITQANFP
jgi:hypothetical protein